jgi:hypothetical protein
VRKAHHHPLITAGHLLILLVDDVVVVGQERRCLPTPLAAYLLLVKRCGLKTAFLLQIDYNVLIILVLKVLDVVKPHDWVALLLYWRPLGAQLVIPLLNRLGKVKVILEELDAFIVIELQKVLLCSRALDVHGRRLQNVRAQLAPGQLLQLEQGFFSSLVHHLVLVDLELHEALLSHSRIFIQDRRVCQRKSLGVRYLVVRHELNLLLLLV